jgi:4-aminobutyrate aminotransferase/(S)-3-amino-2-methylpropionate transaminase
MGSGMPVGAVMGKAHILDAAIPGTIGGTYLGNPLSMVAVSATIDYMQSIHINARGKQVGEQLRTRFNQLKEKFPQHITSVRGLGAMMAFELSEQGDYRRPNTALAKKMVQKCYEKGLIIISAGVHGNVIRNLAPLVITDEQLQSGLDIIESALTELVNE